MLLLTTMPLSPNMQLSLLIGTPKYHTVMQRSRICSIEAQADEYSEPCVSLSALDFFLLCQSIVFLFSMRSTPVTDLQVMKL